MREYGNGRPAPGRVEDVRRQNLTLALGQIQPHSRSTRAEIAGQTGLTKASVSSLVAELLETGLIEEVGVARGGERGRPGMGLVLNPQRGALGAEVNVDYLAVGVVDLLGDLRFSQIAEHRNPGRSPGDVMEDLSAMVRRAATAAEDAGIVLLGGGLAVPGLVDAAAGRVVAAPNLGWRDAGLSGALASLLPGTPFGVVLSNEANSAALAELWYGRGSSLRDYLYVSGEVGVGGGLVLGAELFDGPHGHAGEIGHVVVDPGGGRCSCGGRGCLETVAGQQAVFSAARIGGGAAARRMDRLLQALEAGTTEALEAVERAGNALGVAVVSASRLVNVSAVVLGGHFAALRPWIMPSLLRSLEDFGPGVVPAEGVVFSGLGQTAGLRGAAGTSLRTALARPYDLITGE
ncbi:MAG: MarR family transcriptional regulator [Pseudarthrobacter sp.]|nr:MarR family transcriptional regulator [Pseudarthrobacter sp.]